MTIRGKKRHELLRAAALIGGFVLIAVIFWIDFTTDIWQGLVIMSGLASGLVTFLLTVLVLDRIIAKRTEERWAPVNRLALTEFLHDLADEERSEIALGVVVPRALPIPDTGSGEPLADQLAELRARIVKERRALTSGLSRWAEFLASSGDNESILRHVAVVALALDRIRDLSVGVEQDASRLPELTAEIEHSNAAFAQMVAAIDERLATHAKYSHPGVPGVRSK